MGKEGGFKEEGVVGTGHVLRQHGQGLDGGLAETPVVVVPKIEEDGEDGGRGGWRGRGTGGGGGGGGRGRGGEPGPNHG